MARSHFSKKKVSDELYEVRNVDWKSYSKIAALMMAVNGIIMDIIVYIGAKMGLYPYMILNSFGLYGYTALFLLYFVAGFVAALIALGFYNLFAMLVGGIKLKMEKK